MTVYPAVGRLRRDRDGVARDSGISAAPARHYPLSLARLPRSHWTGRIRNHESSTR